MVNVVFGLISEMLGIIVLFIMENFMCLFWLEMIMNCEMFVEVLVVVGIRISGGFGICSWLMFLNLRMLWLWVVMMLMFLV